MTTPEQTLPTVTRTRTCSQKARDLVRRRRQPPQPGSRHVSAQDVVPPLPVSRKSKKVKFFGNTAPDLPDSPLAVPVPSTSRAAGSAEQPTTTDLGVLDEWERLSASESRSYSAGQEQNARRRTRRTLRKKHRITQSIRPEGWNPTRLDSTAGVTQPSHASSSDHDHGVPIGTPNTHTDLPGLPAKSDSRGDQSGLPNTRDGEQTAREETTGPSGLRDAVHRAARSVRVGPKVVREPARMTNLPQSSNADLTGDKHPPSKTISNTEKDPPGSRAAHDGGNPRKMSDAWDTRIAREEIAQLRRDLSESRRRIAELERRCDVQTKDLENSNSFFNTADKSSDTDIIQALQRLNAEVQQITTYMADCLAEELEFGSQTTKEQSLAVRKISDYVGKFLVNYMATMTADDIPMLLQIAFQTYLVAALYQIASAWTFDPMYNAFIHGTYQRLRKTEAQAISARWRVLAHAHSAQNWSTDAITLVKEIIAGLSSILSAAGCTTTRSAVVAKLTTKFEEKITLLVELARRLNALFDEVVSSDFEVFTIRSGERFDGRMMEEDTDEDQVEVPDGRVLCATHLGLVKRMPIGASLWEKGKKRTMIVVKAKVVLESFLNTGAEDRRRHSEAS